ncbi:hypothetical protein [Pectobacterium phage PEAT2]|uniref:Uncharacterized protein n=1 Tax=Pectobacterium phage PEAT2 TaxID=2053078 RepID=A0A2H4N7C9_9CAUD|nr:hypothetical protein F8206_gp12 [Pectobacterium phage PEAT2]ATV25093.1 hypothetical protein [Pectobacterium phage PEAT2]
MSFGLRRRRHVPSAFSALLVEWIRSSHGVPVESTGSAISSTVAMYPCEKLPSPTGSGSPTNFCSVIMCVAFGTTSASTCCAVVSISGSLRLPCNSSPSKRASCIMRGAAFINSPVAVFKRSNAAVASVVSMFNLYDSSPAVVLRGSAPCASAISSSALPNARSAMWSSFGMVKVIIIWTPVVRILHACKKLRYLRC